MAVMHINQAKAEEMYLNYHCYGNTMNVSNEEMGYIVATYGDLIPDWQATIESDAVEYDYDFDDSEFTTGKEKGVEEGKEATDDYDQTGDTAGTVVGTGVAVGAAATSVVASCIMVGAQVVNGTTKAAKGRALTWVAAGLNAALAALYWIIRPNKDGKDACEQMNPLLDQAQTDLATEQSNMEQTEAEIQALEEEAIVANEETQERIDEEVGAEIILAQNTIKSLNDERGRKGSLSAADQKKYDEAVAYLNEDAGTAQDDIQTENEDNKQ